MCRWLPQIIQLKIAQLELEPSWPNSKSHALTHCSGCFQFVRQTWVQRILDLKLLTYITTKQILLFSQPRFTHSINILMKAFLVKPFLTKQPHTFWMKQQFEKKTTRDSNVLHSRYKSVSSERELFKGTQQNTVHR